MAEDDGFWTVGGWKKVTKRIEDGFKAQGELVHMFEERAALERDYASRLEQWANKWEEGPGAALCVETRNEVREGASRRAVEAEELARSVSAWIRTNYSKGLLGLKERREAEEAFRRAEKPWASQSAKTEATRSAYHAARAAEAAASAFRADAAPALSEDQLHKLDKKLMRAEKEVTQTKERYLKTVGELAGRTPKYREQMAAVFERLQSRESMRLSYVRDILVRAAAAFAPPSVSSAAVGRIRAALPPTNDALTAFATKYGPAAPAPPFPVFEEFDARATPLIAGWTQGVKVRALYDYVAAASDELSLVQGDEFTMLQPEDDLGWCRGLKEGRVGLFPAKYASPV